MEVKDSAFDDGATVVLDRLDAAAGTVEMKLKEALNDLSDKVCRREMRSIIYD